MRAVVVNVVVNTIYILLFVSMISLVLLNYLVKRDVEWATISSAQQAQLLSGDIIFTEGASFKSDIVRLFSGKSDSDISHCGLIKRGDGGELYVVHMSIDKSVISQESLEEFIVDNRVRGLYLCRVEGEYDRAQIEQRLDMLLASTVAFDHRYNAADPVELYCSELVCMIYNSLFNINLYPHTDRKKLIYPNDIYINNQLIKNLKL